MTKNNIRTENTIFSQRAKDVLSERVTKLLKPEAFFGAQVSQDDFKLYGDILNREFVPYWNDLHKSFSDFTEEKAGLDIKPEMEIASALEQMLIESKIPMRTEDLELIKGMSDLFTSDEVDSLRAHALSVQDELFADLIPGMEKVGWAKKGQITRYYSPLDRLRDLADVDIGEFYAEVRDAGDTLFGITQFQNGEKDLDVIKLYKSLDAIYSEPHIKDLIRERRALWAVVISGVASSRIRQNPILALDFEQIDLVVSDTEKNENLTRSLLGRKDLLRYWVGGLIIEMQRKRMSNLQYLFEKVSYRKEVDANGKAWKGIDILRKNDDIQ